MAASAAGIAAIDTVFTDIDNLDALKKESTIACQDGFSAKAVIHPKHVDIVNAAFTPTDNEVAWAKNVLAAFEADPQAGVVKIDGKMIDKPHQKAAQKILDMAAYE
jgi:citrate lyase subunit beta/citryl-CoA lyase